VIVFVSDHGDMMGDHDMYRKSVGYEGSARVPLVVHVPPRWREGWGEGGKVDTIAELRDVMPTLLGTAGVPVPDGVDGIDLRRETREHLHGEHLISALGRHSMQWIRSARHKYVWFSGDGHEQLFDLEEDPHELHDLAGDPAHGEELARHRALLVAELEGREEGFVADGELVAGRPLQSEASWVREHARL
jgi:arylsulfatase A-like enzyme